jgi:hypothetical protein
MELLLPKSPAKGRPGRPAGFWAAASLNGLRSTFTVDTIKTLS